MKVDKQLVIELMKKHIDSVKQLIDWDKVLYEYNATTGEDRTKKTLQSIWDRLPRHKKNEIKNGSRERAYKDSFSKTSDGGYLYDRLILMHEGDMIDDTKVLQAFNLDPLKWVITSSTFNLWSVESTDKRLNNYQAKIKVKPKLLNDINKNDLEDLFSKVYVHPKVKVRKVLSDDSYALRLTDNHIGSSVFSDYAMYQMVQNAKKDIEALNVEKVYIDFLGDILHVDNISKTTDKGTQLEMPMSAYDMVRKAQEVITYTIKELAIVDTEVRWVQGNHSRLVEWLFFRIIEQSFELNDHIKFFVDETRRKSYMIYKTFNGLFHGDMPKKNYYDVFHFEFSDIWGQANRWELHSGHFHSLTQTTKGGMLHTIHGVHKATDDYENSLGYVNMWRKVEAVVYNKELGRIKTYLY